MMDFGDDINVGDTVFIRQGASIEAATVTRVTPTTLKVKMARNVESTVNRRNGRIHGADSMWSRSLVVKDSPMVRAEWQAYISEQYRSSLARKADAFPWHKLTTETLEQILTIAEKT